MESIHLVFYTFVLYYAFLIKQKCTNLTPQINFKFFNIIIILYFIVDIFFKIKNQDYIFVFHHILPIIMLLNFNQNSKIEVYVLYLCLLMEISSIFLSFKKFRVIKNNKTLNNINDIMFASTFLIIRIYFVCFTLLNIISNKNKYNNSINKLCIFALIGLNFYWAFFIIKKIKQKIEFS